MMEILRSKETLAVYRGLLGAQMQRLRHGLQRAYHREEHQIRDQLSRSSTFEGINFVVRQALERLAIGGVNVYRYNRESTYLKSMEREALQGVSRYATANPIMSGEKNHFICSGLDILLVDRFHLEEFSPADREQAELDFESDLKKYFGEKYAASSPSRVSTFREALRYNLYVKYPGHENFDMIIMANQHVRNQQRVLEGEAPLHVFWSADQQEILFDTLRSLKTSINCELVKAEIMRHDRQQLFRAGITHDLHMELDRSRDQQDLFELLLTNLPAQFMRTEENSFVHRSSIMLYDEDADVLRIAAARNIANCEPVKSGESVSWQVFKTGNAALRINARFTKGSFMSVPIRFEDKIYGVLNVRSNHSNAFKLEDLQHLEILASILASKMRITSLMTMDGLTRVLYQRRWGISKLNQMLAEAKKTNSNLAFIIFDADHFKQINDHYGHGAGDLVLKDLALTIHRFILAHKEELLDHVEIRWGGEELVIGLLGVGRKRAYELSNQLREEIKSRKDQIAVTASAGIALYPHHGNNIDELANNADRALYSSKRTTRDRVTVYNPNDLEMNQIALP